MPGLTIGGRGINGAAACDAWALSVVFFLLGDTLPAEDTLESIGICCVTAAVTRDRYVCHDLLMALDMCYPVCCYGHHEVPRRMPDHRPRLEDMHDSMLFLCSLESICTALVKCNFVYVCGYTDSVCV